MISELRNVLKSWWTRLFLIAVALSFVVSFGVGSFGNPKQVVARVDGDEILAGEFSVAYDQQLERLRQTAGEDVEELAEQLGLRDIVLQRMINHRLLLHEADRRGLRVPDVVLAQHIRSLPYFQRDGVFSEDLYRSLLASNGLNPRGFERQAEEDLLVARLVGMLSEAVVVGPLEMENVYRARNEQVRVEAAQLNYKNFKRPAAADEAALEEYYQSRSLQFTLPAAVKLSYLVLSLEDMRQGLQVPERLIRRHYEREVDKYSTPVRMRARHILLNVPADAGAEGEAKARKRLEGIALQVAKGASFAQLARQHSEGPSKTRGGDLGYFTAKDMVPNFSKAAFALKAGEVSSVVKTPFGLHLIQAVAIQPSQVKPYQSVRGEIRQQLLLKLSERRLNRELRNLPGRIKEEGFAAVAAELKKPLRRTDWLTGEVSWRGLGAVRDLVAQAVKQEVGEVGALQRNAVRGHVFYEVLAIRPAKQRPLDEVRSEVAAVVLQQQWRRAAFGQAQTEINKLKNLADWRLLLRRHRLAPKTFQVSAAHKQQQANAAVQRAAFRLSSQQPFALVAYQNQAWVVRLVGRKLTRSQPAPEQAQQLQRQLRNALLQSVEANEIARLRKKADIDAPQPQQQVSNF